MRPNAPRRVPSRLCRRAGAVVLCLSFALVADLGAQTPVPVDSLDAIFAGWNRTDSPGCVLGVVRAGDLVFARGYGSANLDYETPLAPNTVFYMASVSKQFTAAAVTLAARQGHLSLDDDVRRWVPELPDYGETIRVRHLIHHTSGLRDYLTLMSLAGMRYADVHPADEILELIAHQRELNFAPGDDYLYSNSGYFLLSVIVERATGQSLREFTTEYLFEPLGMRDTHFHDDAGHVQRNRAISYGGGRDGEFRISFLGNFDQVGSGGLYSTVEDLARWDRNFFSARIGGRGFIDTLHTRGLLNDGDTLDYAFGLTIGEYRGLRTVSHSGSMMGFKTALLRFPDERLTTLTLCNLGSIDAMRLARRAAAAILADRLEERVVAGGDAGGTDRDRQAEAGEEDGEARDAAPDPLSPAELRTFVGEYYSPELDATYSIGLEDGDLRLRRPNAGPRTLEPEARDVFAAGSYELHFERDARGDLAGFRLMAGRVRNLLFERRGGATAQQ